MQLEEYQNSQLSIKMIKEETATVPVTDGNTGYRTGPKLRTLQEQRNEQVRLISPQLDCYIFLPAPLQKF